MPKALPDGKRKAILADLEAGKARNQIAREHEVGAGTVTRLAQANGIALDRAKTEIATRAQMADVRSRRAQIAAELLEDIPRLRRRAWSPYQHVVTGPEGSEVITLPLPPLGEVRNAYAAIGIAMDKHLACERLDIGQQAMAAVDQWLDAIAG